MQPHCAGALSTHTPCFPRPRVHAGLVVRGRHWLLLAPRGEAARPRRTLQQELGDPPLLAFGPIPRGVGRWEWAGGQAQGAGRAWWGPCLLPSLVAANLPANTAPPSVPPAALQQRWRRRAPGPAPHLEPERGARAAQVGLAARAACLGKLTGAGQDRQGRGERPSSRHAGQLARVLARSQGCVQPSQLVQRIQRADLDQRGRQQPGAAQGPHHLRGGQGGVGG